MRSKVDPELRAQAVAFGLRFCCEDCAYFDVNHAECSHGYPTAEHRQGDLDRQHTVVFCKEFELV